MMGFVIPGMQPGKIHDRKSEDMLKEALDLAKNSDVVIAALGENANMNGEGASRSIPDIPEPQMELLKSLVATGKPVVLVIFTGRPLILSWEDENVPAILNAWFPGSEAGTSIAGILFGDVNPSGKLTTSFPRNAGQIPIFYNHKNTGRPHGEFEEYSRFRSNYIDVINAPLYPFGYGLSYTKFDYGDVTLSAKEMLMNGKVTASVTVKNSGPRDGKEIVQLYIRDVFSTSTRPVKELKAFRKIFLKAGENREISFELTAEDLKYYNHDLAYICEPGDFEIMIGPNSRDVKAVKLTLK
jgi:beta-glucosidase